MKINKKQGCGLQAVMFAAIFMLAVPMQAYAYADEGQEVTTDSTKPTLNAAVSNGRLTVEAYDESGIAAIYVNDYEFTDVPEGRLSVRLQQFDAGYEYFTVTAVDNAGNCSDVYQVENPYYGDDEAAGELPADAEASAFTDAEADVTEYTEVAGDDGSKKLFYTFETENGKVFYLVIERDDNGDTVHFLTDVGENDLLNAVSDSSETLPKNSAARMSEIVQENAQEAETVTEIQTQEPESSEEISTEPETEAVTADSEDKPMGAVIVLGIAGAAVFGTAYYLKYVRKKDTFLDEEDDDDGVEEIEEIEEDGNRSQEQEGE